MAVENTTGASASGSSGDASRVLTLSNASLTSQTGFQVFVGGLYNALTTDYTVSHLDSGTTITFVAPLYDDSIIAVFYNVGLPQVAATAGVIPLDARFIQKNIAAVGNTCTITEVAVTIGSDEYRTKSESTTDNTSIPCFVHVLSYEDDIVKQGDARAGDLVFWFDAAYLTILTRSTNDKVRITWNSNTYEVKDVRPFYATGDVLYLIEVKVAQI